MSMYDNLKQKTFDANQQLPKRGIVIYTFGNVSIVDRQKNVFCIKPSGVPYEEMKPEDMVVLDMNNNVIEGDLNPSSDTNSHWVLYK
ncbi:MAG: class II aldolase/adducin family protein, partial [Spirochaetales bacterium]|nr:class II aldolase/adducin family protein [Spirochaetales bacterium]